MTDNEFWTIIQATLLELRALGPIPAARVSTGYQIRQHGAPANPQVSYYQVTSKRYGWQGRHDVNNEAESRIDHTEVYYQERTIQVSATVDEDPNDTSLPTAFDVVEGLAYQLNTIAVVNSLLDQGIGIIRIQDVRVPFFDNDRDRNQSVPNFDFTVYYKQEVTSEVPELTEITAATVRGF